MRKFLCLPDQAHDEALYGSLNDNNEAATSLDFTMPGYEYTFVSEVPDECCCPICQCPMKEPVQTKCGHRFCSECLQKSLKRKKKCPNDRRPLDQRNPTDIYPDVAIKRTILDFIVKCPYETNSCKWTGELRGVEAHEAVCDFIGVQCTNKDCKVTPLKKDLLKHVTKECPKREVECRYCKASFVWCMRQDHFDICGKYPMTCLQKCGEQKIAREKMNYHIEESCLHTEIECTYAHVGCKVKVQRRDMEEHVKANTESHLKLACEKLQEFQASSAVNGEDVKELQAEIAKANKRIEKLSQLVLKNEWLQELREKVAITDEKVQELQTKDDEKTNHGRWTLRSEFNTLVKQFKELKNDASNERKRLLELQDSVSYGFQDLRGEVNGIRRRQQKLETANTDFKDVSEKLEKAVSDQWDEIVRIERGTDYRIGNFYQQVCVQLNSYHETLQNFKNRIFEVCFIVICCGLWYFGSYYKTSWFHGP